MGHRPRRHARGFDASVTTDSPKAASTARHETFTIYDADQLLTAQPWNDADSGLQARCPRARPRHRPRRRWAGRTSSPGWSDGNRALISDPDAACRQRDRNADRSKPFLQQFAGRHAAGVKTYIIIDRTRRSERRSATLHSTLMRRSRLVVKVISCFWRSLSATIKPSSTVPFRGRQGCAHVWEGFSLDTVA